MVNADDDMGNPVADTLLDCCVIGQAEAPEGVIEAWKSSQEAKGGYGEQTSTHGQQQQTHGGHGQQQQSGGYGQQEQEHDLDDMQSQVYGGHPMGYGGQRRSYGPRFGRPQGPTF